MPMGFLRLAMAAGLLLAAALPAAADQNDPRLDGLFESLHLPGSAERARQIEMQIWSIWMEADDPQWEALMQRGLAAMHARDLPAALAIYTDLVQRAPGFAEAWNKRATVYFLMGEIKASLADVERTLALEPRHFGALAGAGQINLQRGLLRGAYQAFHRALEINPHLKGPQMFIEMLRDEVEGKPL